MIRQSGPIIWDDIGDTKQEGANMLAALTAPEEQIMRI